MLMVVMTPILVLVGMTANTFGNTLDNYIQSQSVRSDLFRTVDIGAIITELQIERDMNALYLSIISGVTKEALLVQYPKTDQAVQNLTFWITDTESDKLEFSTPSQFISHLNRHRYQLDVSSYSLRDELLFYTDAIEEFRLWHYESIVEAQSATVWTSLVAYQEVIVASDYLGRERSYGVVFYAIGNFPTTDYYLQFLECQDVSDMAFESAQKYSSLVYNIYEEKLKGNETVLSTIMKMREEIKARGTKVMPGSLDMAWVWYQNMSRYQRVIFDTQVCLFVICI
jgi:hypothetical protein